MPAVDKGLPRFVQNRLHPQARFGLRATLFGIAIVLVAVPFAYLLFEVLGKGSLTRSDEQIAVSIHNWVLRRRGFVPALDAISWLGKPLWLGIAVTAAAVYVVWRGRRRLGLYLVVTVVGGGLVDSAVKLAVNRPRPDLSTPLAHAIGKSFPSGHAMSSTVTYGALLLIFLPALPKVWRLVAIAGTTALLLVIGLSRLMLGVHFVSDVLGGYVLGLAWLVGVTAAFSIWRTETGKQPVHPTVGLEPEAAPALSGEAVPKSK